MLPSSTAGPGRDSQSLPPLALQPWEVGGGSTRGARGGAGCPPGRDVRAVASFPRRLRCRLRGAEAEDPAASPDGG